jgi:Cys-tRNA(Pro)/Cys-tRNA(Cys) deacylase
MKTNAARLLDEAGIPYELREYEVDPEDLRAETVADKIGVPAEQVFKTLVVSGERTGVCLAVVPGDAELDLKALAKLAGDRKMELAALKEVQPLTGYIRGGVTALAQPSQLDSSTAEMRFVFNKGTAKVSTTF